MVYKMLKIRFITMGIVHLSHSIFDKFCQAILFLELYSQLQILLLIPYSNMIDDVMYVCYALILENCFKERMDRHTRLYKRLKGAVTFKQNIKLF